VPKRPPKPYRADQVELHGSPPRGDRIDPEQLRSLARLVIRYLRAGASTKENTAAGTLPAPTAAKSTAPDSAAHHEVTPCYKSQPAPASRKRRRPRRR
jgi:hypothetical protein